MYTETECRHGTFRYFTADNIIGRALTEFGEWAEDEIIFVQSLLKEGDTVLDVGTNIGTHAVAFAQKIGPTGTLYAFEPQPEVFKVLEWNIEKNDLSLYVKALNVCVGSESGQQAFPLVDYTKTTNFGAIQVLTHPQKAEHVQWIQQINLDSLNLLRCDFIKLDVEGFEIPVLQGATELLARFKPTLYAECTTLEKGEALITYLKDKGYLVFFHQARAFNPENFRRSTRNFFGPANETSLLFISPERLPKEMNLLEIHTLDEFKEAFLNAVRWEDTHAGKTLAKTQYISQWLNMPTRDAKWSKPIIVIVPVFNASLIKIASHPNPRLAFIFLGDSSADTETQQFCRRADVLTLKNKSIKAALIFAAEFCPEADVVVLNADRLVSPMYKRIAGLRETIAHQLQRIRRAGVKGIFKRFLRMCKINPQTF